MISILGLDLATYYFHDSIVVLILIKMCEFGFGSHKKNHEP
jgi:hypothetical protein